MATFQSWNSRTNRYVKHVDGRIRGTSETPFPGVPIKKDKPDSEKKNMVAETKPDAASAGGYVEQSQELEDVPGDSIPDEDEPDRPDKSENSPFLFWL